MTLDYRRVGARKMMENVERVVFIGSGKGGVGKSLVASTITLKLSRLGFKVGLLDLDLHGPVASTIFPSERGYEESREGLKPPVVYGVKVASLSYLVSDEQPVPIRGLDKEVSIGEILSIINWGELDYLIVDLPPGTGDETLTAIRLIDKPKEAVLVTLPSKLSLKVVVRALNYILKLKVPILGVIVNMAGIKCGEELIKPLGRVDVSRELGKYKVKVLSEIPLDPRVNYVLEEGETLKLLDTEFSKALDPVVTAISRGKC